MLSLKSTPLNCYSFSFPNTNKDFQIIFGFFFLYHFMISRHLPSTQPFWVFFYCCWCIHRTRSVCYSTNGTQNDRISSIAIIMVRLKIIPVLVLPFIRATVLAVSFMSEMKHLSFIHFMVAIYRWVFSFILKVLLNDVKFGIFPMTFCQPFNNWCFGEWIDVLECENRRLMLIWEGKCVCSVVIDVDCVDLTMSCADAGVKRGKKEYE